MTLIKQPTPENILLAARNLKDGALIGLPTETVYGLAADAENESAVKRIYEVKGRPSDHPLIVHIASIEYLEKWARDIPEYAWTLAKTFWPGPMTLILKRSQIAKDFVTGKQETIGLRVPNNKVALSLLDSFHKMKGNGLAAPSANLFSRVSPTSPLDVEFSIGNRLSNTRDFILDGGNSAIGIESTIINCTNIVPKILRTGKITYSDMQTICKVEIGKSETDIKISGCFKKHYSPKAKILLDVLPLEGDGYIGKYTKQIGVKTPILLQPINTEELARGLYHAFITADKLKLKRIVISTQGFKGPLMEAILDRIEKASYEKK